MGLAKSIGTNLQAKTLICFPDYDKLVHDNVVASIKGSFEDKNFTDNVTVSNYNSDFRS
jgi:hypothetical protein